MSADSVLVFNLRLTRHKTKDFTTVIFRGTIIPQDIYNNLFNYVDHITLKLIALGIKSPIINILDDDRIPMSDGNPINEDIIFPSSEEEVIRYLPILEKKYFIENEEYRLKLKYLKSSDIANKKLIDSYNLDSFFHKNGENQIFLAKGVTYDTIKNYFFLNKIALSGGNHSMRQWLSTQDYELSIFINCLQLSRLDKKEIYSQNQLLQATYLKDFTLPEIKDYFKTDLSVSEFFRSKLTINDQLNTFLQSKKNNTSKKEIEQKLKSAGLLHSMKDALILFKLCNRKESTVTSFEISEFYDFIEKFKEIEEIKQIINLEFLKNLTSTIEYKELNEFDNYVKILSEDEGTEIPRNPSMFMNNNILSKETVEVLRKEVTKHLLFFNVNQSLSSPRIDLKSFLRFYEDKNKILENKPVQLKGFVSLTEKLLDFKLSIFSNPIIEKNLIQIFEDILIQSGFKKDKRFDIYYRALSLIRKTPNVYKYISWYLRNNNLENEFALERVKESIMNNLPLKSSNLNKFEQDIVTKIITGDHIKNEGIKNLFISDVDYLFTNISKALREENLQIQDNYKTNTKKPEAPNTKNNNSPFSSGTQKREFSSKSLAVPQVLSYLVLLKHCLFTPQRKKEISYNYK